MNTSSPSIAPTTANRTVPLRRPNADLRTREHLTLAEVEKLIETAGANRAGARRPHDPPRLSPWAAGR
jgi:hypothetical protein